jgi:RHS repeat-associated protein
VVKHEHLLGNAQQLVAGFEYDYDREVNRRFEIRSHDSGRGDVFVYDSAYRTVDYKRDVMNPRAEANQTGTGGPVSARTQYKIDGASNWRMVGFGAVMTPFVPNVMNEYETVGGVRQVHDENGNLLDDGQRRFVYDVFNRLIRVENEISGAVMAVYSYDAHNRRVMKRTGQGATSFFYDGWRDIEEQDASRRTIAQYVNGRELDEVVTMDRDLSGDGRTTTFFYHDNAAVMSAAALTDSQGRVVERYSYDLYGEPIVMAASGTMGMESTVGNPFLYQCGRRDAETGFYYYRNRYYNPLNGRFISRDPFGIWGDINNHGNPMAYVGNNPSNRTDPLGLDSPAGTDKASGDKSSPPEISEKDIKDEADRMKKEQPLPRCLWDMLRWIKYDSKYRNCPTQKWKVRGQVMDGGEFNYYYIGMACALKGMSWEECLGMIILYKDTQSIGILPGSGAMTANIQLAAKWGYDENKPPPPPPRFDPGNYDPRDYPPWGYVRTPEGIRLGY